MHPVLCFIKYDGLGTLKHTVRHFHAGKTILFMDFPADGRFQIVERRKAMHKSALRTCLLHKCFVNLIRQKVFNSFFPNPLIASILNLRPGKEGIHSVEVYK
jgi:hypothetical protein